MASSTTEMGSQRLHALACTPFYFKKKTAYRGFETEANTLDARCPKACVQDIWPSTHL